MNLIAGSLGGHFPDFKSNRLEILSILINNNCNHHCQHCYLNGYTERALRYEEWVHIFRSVFSDLEPSVLCVAGKEPFIDSESVSLWATAVSLRNQLQPRESRRTSIGLITNGTLIKNHRDTILANVPDYIDVSVDGLPQSHDKIRGEGAFSTLEPNLRWLNANLPNQTWITHTLFSSNIEELPSFVEFMHREFDLSKFALGIYRHRPHVESTLSLQNHPNQLVETIERLGRIPIRNSVEVILEIAYDQIAEAEALRHLGWEPSSQGGSSDTRLLDNGITFRIDSGSIPTGLWRSVRVSCGGYWLAAEDMIAPSDYSERAIVDLRSCDYDTSRAYELGLQHPRLRELLTQSHSISKGVNTLLDTIC